jgi:hypothetical protein
VTYMPLRHYIEVVRADGTRETRYVEWTARQPTVDESKLPAPPQRSGLEPLPPGYYPKGD